MKALSEAEYECHCAILRKEQHEMDKRDAERLQQNETDGDAICET